MEGREETEWGTTASQGREESRVEGQLFQFYTSFIIYFFFSAFLKPALTGIFGFIFVSLNSHPVHRLICV